MTLVIKNGDVIDPASKTSMPLDILIEGEHIARIGKDLSGDELFDASACRHHMERYTALETQICGMCIAACPLSRKD